jgi:large subunit ribosomal protein L6
MSRIGRMPIPVPQGTRVELRVGRFVAEGPKGRVEQPVFEGYPVEVKDDGSIEVTRPGDSGPQRSLHGLLRALLANAVQGASAGFT